MSIRSPLAIAIRSGKGCINAIRDWIRHRIMHAARAPSRNSLRDRLPLVKNIIIPRIRYRSSLSHSLSFYVENLTKATSCSLVLFL